MIQRIQTLYLFLVVIISVIFMTGNILTYRSDPGQAKIVTFTGVSSITGAAASVREKRMIPLTALSVLVPVFALVSVLLYRRRRIQTRFAIITLLIDILLLMLAPFYYFYLVRSGAKEIMPAIRLIIPMISLILIILAIKGIRRDENLVRSYDRLR